MTKAEALSFLKEKYPVGFSRYGDTLTITFNDGSNLKITIVESSFSGRDAGELGIPCFVPSRSFSVELNDNIVSL